MNANYCRTDFFILKDVPGFFATRNEGARWLQEHRDDPYWMAHQLFDFHRGDDFMEAWRLAREIKGLSENDGS